LVVDVMMSTSTLASPASFARDLSEFLATDGRIKPFIRYRPDSLESGAQHMRGLQAILFDEGWSRCGWPERCGGLGGDGRLRAAMFEALWEQDILIPEAYTTLETLVPVLLKYAPHLADELFPALLRGTEAWTQAFSEPDAGSDLASLRTRMQSDGFGWRVTGQKVWATYGHLADRAVLLARSGEPGHRGLSMVLVDLDQPGVEVRPIRAEDGENHFAEIFLNGVFAPAARVIGTVGQGWEIAMYMLQWERGAWGWLQQGRFHSRLEHALAAIRDPGAAHIIGRAYVASTALRTHSRKTVERLARDERLGPEVSVDKLLLVEAELATWDAVRHALGSHFDLDEELAWMRTEFMLSRAAPIYGGSHEIQRTLVAQRVLGMPREG
jgi:alkylation response protein AidB-like acyl-CoA dehydrogenase